MIFHRIILSGYPTASKVLESIKSTVTTAASKCTSRQAQRQRPKLRNVQLGHAIGGHIRPIRSSAPAKRQFFLSNSG